jgi:hypothetical protein
MFTGYAVNAKKRMQQENKYFFKKNKDKKFVMFQKNVYLHPVKNCQVKYINTIKTLKYV